MTLLNCYLLSLQLNPFLLLINPIRRVLMLCKTFFWENLKDKVLYLILPMLSTILTILCTTLQPLWNCHKSHCNGYPILNWAYLYNHWVKWYDLKTIRKPRLITLLDPANAKHHSHSIKHYIAHFKYLHIYNGSLQWIP